MGEHSGVGWEPSGSMAEWEHSRWEHDEVGAEASALGPLALVPLFAY